MKNLCFRPITVKWEVSEGIRDRRAQGLGTTGWVGRTAWYDAKVLD